MEISVDLRKLEQYVSLIEEELREINRLTDLVNGKLPDELVTQPNIEQIMINRRRFVAQEKENIRARLAFIEKMIEKLTAVTATNEDNLNLFIERFRHGS